MAQTLYTDFRNRVSKARTVPGISREIRSFCQYIQAHIAEKLTVPQLAAQFGYTDYYFSRKFHAETGEHILSYIRHAKIETAAFFLANTSMSIQEISDSLHFSNRNLQISSASRWAALPLPIVRNIRHNSSRKEQSAKIPAVIPPHKTLPPSDFLLRDQKARNRLYAMLPVT